MKLKLVYELIRRQFRDLTLEGEVSFMTLIVEQRARITEAAESSDKCKVMAESAALGGIYKRWSRFLIQLLSDYVLQGQDTSRYGVRIWQKYVFGKSVAATELKDYAKSSRSGGGRSNGFIVNERREKLIKEMYLLFKEQMKGVR